jgi:hypothetical protein
MAPAEGPRGVSLAPAHEHDLEQLVQVRLEAMRESLERIGRFDPERARQRFVKGFVPEHTRHVLLEGERAGFVVVAPTRIVVHGPDAPRAAVKWRSGPRARAAVAGIRQGPCVARALAF